MRNIRIQPNAHFLATVLLAAVLVSGALARGAAAEPVVSVLDDSGASSPVLDVERRFRFEGTAAANEALFVGIVSSWDDPCPATARAYVDSSQPTWNRFGGVADAVWDDGYSEQLGRALPNGAYSFEDRVTWTMREATFLCMWQGVDLTNTSAPTKQYIPFRLPTGKLSVSVRGVLPKGGAIAAGRPTGATVTGTVEARSWLIVSPRTGTRSCPTEFDENNPDGVNEKQAIPPGPFRYVTGDWREVAVGHSAVVCVWLQSNTIEQSDVRAKGSVSYFITAARPIRCIVPKVRGMNLAAARHAIAKSGCIAATPRYVRNPRVATGTVLGTDPRPGTRHLLRTRITPIVDS